MNQGLLALAATVICVGWALRWLYKDMPVDDNPGF